MAEPDAEPRPPAGDQGSQPLLPAHTSDESDAGWGEPPEPDDDERLRRDRPPHWDNP